MVNRNNPRLFVQFLHPGQEHTPNKNNPNHIDWNKGDHKRKFLKNPGIYLDGNNKVKSDVIFWGEWEAPSDMIQKLIIEEETQPKYLFQPYFSPLQYQGFLQNTDPFVFGDNFYYVCCRQTTKRGSTQLRFLGEGSVILFGSRLNHKFVLDTVFVVDKYYDIKSLKQVSQYVPDTYVDVTLKHILSCGNINQNKCSSNQNFRLYIGAKFDNPKNEMFSFFPCLPYKAKINNGFSRPVIQIPNIISDNQSQGYKINRNFKTNIKELWTEVKNQVEKANLNLGIYTELPLRKL